MPSQVPSSFASAAGSGSIRDPRNSRGDGRGTDWSAQRTRGTNGTVTLRRSSTTPYTKSTADSEAQQPARFGANHLVDVFRRQDSSSKVDVSHLFTNTWDPGHTNGANGRGWGKNTDRQDSNAPESCWTTDGKVAPKTLEEKTDLEKNLFDTEVNSPMKPPPQSLNKDVNGQGLGPNGRKASIGQNSSPFGISSPSSTRPGTRRQQTSDSVTGLGSPAGNGRFSRDDNNTSFSGRMLNKDGPDDRPEPTFRSGLTRSNTGGTGLGNGPASPSTWGNAPSSATLGSFGHFALGGSGTPLTPGEKKAPFGSSRFGKLMTKDSSEDVPSKVATGGSWRGRQRTDTTDTDPYGSDNATGSAALGGGQDTSPPFNSNQRAPGLETPVRAVSSDFGMSDISSFREARTQSHQTPQARLGQEPLSPIDTNPYRSPPENETERDDESYDGDALQQIRLSGLGGIPEHGPSPFGHLPRGFPNAAFDESDRSQNSSVGANRPYPTPLGVGGLPSLSGLGSMGGWPSSANISTPDRENRSAFSGPFGNNSAFGPTGDLQSPGFSAMSSSGFGAATTAPAGGSSRRLASFLPPAMQAQMQAAESESPVEGGHNTAFGTIGRTSAFPRDTDSPLRTGRSAFDDSGPDNDSARNMVFFSSADVTQGQTATSFPQGPPSQSNFQQSQTSSIDSAANQLPSSQQRTMVMPDRMRWVYLDPQGQIQGPWSGLEMHDWYKANFFTADLSVRKLEDTEFEPLGQLIRRIGNSREPFLVPQIGIPHGAPAAPAGAPFTPTAAPGNSAAQAGSVQPPFAGAFPSFGTTLTAEQQNNLERRKQEEQYLMARQREFLQQQQNLKQMQMSGVPSALHHQSSAHSLQSQPSFGSMTSPIGMPTQPPVQGVPGFFDGPPRQAPTSGISDFLQQEDGNRLNLQDRQQQLFGSNIPASQGIHAQQINALFGQPSDTQQQNAARLEQARQEPRFREWEQLRSQTDIEETGQPAAANFLADSIAPPHQHQQQYTEPLETQFERPAAEVPEVLSLSQQIQKIASAKQSPIHAAQIESPWAKVDTNLPMPFPPPPQSTTPLPAPTAQRGRSNLPEALSMEDRSRSGSPEITAATPSIAPWAKEPAEASRGPSLKEIQESEAKKAAKDEERAAATRRALHEQEMRLLASQPVAPAPGLPSTSTWGNTASPAVPSALSPWATKTPAKVQSSSNSASKKTLADIQREEETRKQKLAAAATSTQPPQGLSGGKRYADLASKSSASSSTSASPWATVGAGGKVKIPTGPAATAPQTLRSTSSAAIPTVASRSTRPTATTRSVTTSGQSAALLAKDEFKKWVTTSLTKGLPSTVNVDDFAATISDFDPELMVEAVYGASEMAMDGRHFAEEYQRRRKLAEKGVVEPSSTGSGTTFSTGSEKASGWSEVAKKGPPKEESTAGYKVVPNKKKGGKK